MSERRAYLKSTLFLLASNAVVLAVGFLSRPLIARFLGPAEYGVFALIVSTAAALSTYQLFSLNLGLVYRVAREPGKAGEYASTTIAFLAAATLILAVPAYLVLRLAAPSLDSFAFAAAYALAFATSLLCVVQSVQQGLKLFKDFSVANAASSLLAAVLSVAAAYLFVSGWVSGFTRALAVFAVAATYLLLFKRFGRVTRAAFDSVWSYSKPIAFASFFGVLIIVVDKYFLAAYRSTAEVGYYDLALALVSAILPFTVSLTTAMMPELMRSPKKIEAYYPRVAASNTAFLTCFGLGLYYYADIVINLLVGPAYVSGTVPLLRILALALPLMSFYNLNGSVYQSIGKPLVTALLSVSLVAASVLFNWLLVPSYGAEGAAWAALCTYLVIAVASTVMLRSRERIGTRMILGQLALFLFFAAGYWLVPGIDFAEKTAGLILFGLATLAFNRRLVAEVLETAKGFSPVKALWRRAR